MTHANYPISLAPRSDLISDWGVQIADGLIPHSERGLRSGEKKSADLPLTAVPALHWPALPNGRETNLATIPIFSNKLCAVLKKIAE